MSVPLEKLAYALTVGPYIELFRHAAFHFNHADSEASCAQLAEKHQITAAEFEAAKKDLMLRRAGTLVHGILLSLVNPAVVAGSFVLGCIKGFSGLNFLRLVFTGFSSGMDDDAVMREAVLQKQNAKTASAVAPTTPSI